MIYITGDCHGNFYDIKMFCKKHKTKRSDIIIILGDAGINYYGDERDVRLKKMLKDTTITFFCIHGNHEIRPQNIPTYITKQWHEGTVFFEEKYPNILFAKDGEIFDFGGQKCIVIGGAYSVDKYYRLEHGYGWWPDEQPSEQIKHDFCNNLINAGNKVDVVLSHTCPLRYEPVESFLPFVDQSAVDKSTEKWLDSLIGRFSFKRWYCGHYHTNKIVDKMVFIYKNVKEFKEQQYEERKGS